MPFGMDAECLAELKEILRDLLMPHSVLRDRRLREMARSCRALRCLEERPPLIGRLQFRLNVA